MNPTKGAAYLSLCVAIAAAGYLLYQLYENVVLLRSSIDAFGGPEHSMLWEYGVPGGIAVAALIASFVLFGAARR